MSPAIEGVTRIRPRSRITMRDPILWISKTVPFALVSIIWAMSYQCSRKNASPRLCPALATSTSTSRSPI